MNDSKSKITKTISLIFGILILFGVIFFILFGLVVVGGSPNGFAIAFWLAVPCVLLGFGAYKIFRNPDKSVVQGPVGGIVQKNDKINLLTVFLIWLVLIGVNDQISGFIFGSDADVSNKDALHSILSFFPLLLVIILLAALIAVSNNSSTRKAQISSLEKFIIYYLVAYYLIAILLKFV